MFALARQMVIRYGARHEGRNRALIQALSLDALGGAACNLSDLVLGLGLGRDGKKTGAPV